MMKSVDFETRECSRDKGLRLTASLGVEMITHFDAGDSIKVSSNEVGL